MCLKCLDGAFRSVHLVIVWFNQHQVALFTDKVVFDDTTCLIVHDIRFDLMPFGFKKFKLLNICGKDAVVCEIGDGWCHYGISFVEVDDQETHAPFKGHNWE